MKKILFIIFLICGCFSSKAITDLSQINSQLTARKVSGSQIDTINLQNRLVAPDNKLVLYISNWCPPSYAQLNRLYAAGVIDSLIEADYSLIVIADKYPCIKLNSDKIEGDWNQRFLADFEIYYEVCGQRILEDLSGASSFPYLLLIMDGRIVRQESGLKEDYSEIITLINVPKIR